MLTANEQLIITNCPREAHGEHLDLIVNEQVIKEIRSIIEDYLLEDCSMATLTEYKQAVCDAFMIRKMSIERKIDINTAVCEYFTLKLFTANDH